MEASTDLFINLIQNNRIIYDKTLKDFKNTKKKDEAWKTIATQSRMTVDAVKKRYFSLRQKYCREKRNLEMKRRYKIAVGKYWIYYERLHFLDAFIQPRITYTNDTGFVEGGDEEFIDEETVDQQIIDEDMIDEEIVRDTLVSEQNIIIEMEDDTTFNGQYNISGDDQITDTTESSLIGYGCITEFRSEYTGDVATIHHSPSSTSSPSRDDAMILQNTGPISNNIAMVTADERPDVLDSNISDYPTTSSSHNIEMNFASPSLPSGDSSTPKTVSAPQGNTVTTALSRPKIGQLSQSHKSDGTRSFTNSANYTLFQSPLQPEMPPLPRSRSSAPKNTFFHRQNSEQVTPSILSSHRTVPVSNLSSRKSGESRQTTSHATTSTAPSISDSQKEKNIEAIRQKMDSCLTAINRKISDKEQRSPHAPFLAYLGTKLPNVSKEKLAALEREILDLVDFNSK